MVDTYKIKDDELDRLLEALNKESRERKERRQEQIAKIKAEQVEFLTKCRYLTQVIIPVLEDTSIDRSLE